MAVHIKNQKRLKSIKAYPFRFALLLFFLGISASSYSAFGFPPNFIDDRCEALLTGGSFEAEITASKLLDYASQKIIKVPEFSYIRSEAKKMGIRVWLFGGTASGFLHYVKWDLKRKKGLYPFQPDRFDYDFTNIFRSTQDLDIVVDAIPEVAKEFRNLLARRFPYFLGSKANRWEVRTLRYRQGSPGKPGFKEALLDDYDFNHQNTDSNSLGMVEVTRHKEPIVRDLRHWDQPKSLFLEDTLADRITFLRSGDHFTTSRARLGENPEILSLIRLLVKAFQYELKFSMEDFDQMRAMARDFNPGRIRNDTALRRIRDTAAKLVLHALDIEYAMNTLDELGLRNKLIAMGNPSEIGSHSWWLNREPLRSKDVGLGSRRTARELNIEIVSHETNSFLAYESITRAHSGKPNVLISRENTPGESASYGDGFYTRLGKTGARKTGLTIRFRVQSEAREGTDFTIHGDFIVFRNKRALTVIQESLHFSLDDLIHFAETGEELPVDHSNLALLEKLKRRLNASMIRDEFDRLLSSGKEEDQERLIHILRAFSGSTVSKLISEDLRDGMVRAIYGNINRFAPSAKDAIVAFYLKRQPSDIALGRELAILMSSGKNDDRAFAVELLERGDRLRFPILSIYREILGTSSRSGVSSRGDSRGISLEEAKKTWLKDETRPSDAKAQFLMTQVGIPNSKFKEYFELLPETQKREVNQIFDQRGNFNFFLERARNQGVEREFLEIAKGESFEFEGAPFPKVGEPKTFTLGEGNETRRVTLTRPIAFARTAVTQLQYWLVTGKNPSQFKGDGIPDNRPVEKVFYDDAAEYAKKLSELTGDTYRLPTEAEWEYAARGGTETTFYWGNEEANHDLYAWSSKNSNNETHPVAGLLPNAYGLFDMIGNVWEWCGDWYDAYPEGHLTDPQGPEAGSYRVIRGGSWSRYPQGLRSALRDSISPGSGSGVGFRLLRAMP